MKVLDKEEFNKFIKTNYEKIYDTDEWVDFKDELDGFCEGCQKDVFFKIHSRSYQHTNFIKLRIPTFITYFIECPRCNRTRFINFVLLEENVYFGKDTFDEEIINKRYELYQLYSIPTNDENFVCKDIPDNYETLKESVSEALYTMNHGKLISSAIMFRRSLQIIVKDILGAKGNTLFKQLEWLKVNTNLLSIDLTNLFHDNSKLIKDVGNQGAHPDDDITLQNFTKDDVNALHDLFLIIVNEIFIKPAKLKALQEELKKNRKLKTE